MQAYRTRHTYKEDSGRLPLLVHEQLAPGVSGVSFTTDPVSGSQDRFLIEAIAGMGERLVFRHAGTRKPPLVAAL